MPTAAARSGGYSEGSTVVGEAARIIFSSCRVIVIFLDSESILDALRCSDSMATEVIETETGYTENFFARFLGKIRICDDWSKVDGNWRRHVAVAPTKGRTFVGRDHGMSAVTSRSGEKRL